jgi:hypothetical protein
VIYPDDLNLLGYKICTIKRGTETLIHASKAVDLEVNTEKIKYMLMSQNAGQNYDIKIANIHFENVRTRVTNQNLIQEEIKRLNSGNACYHSVQNLLSSRLLAKSLKL